MYWLHTNEQRKQIKTKLFCTAWQQNLINLLYPVLLVYELLRGDNQDEDVYWKVMFNNMTVLDFDSNCAEQAANIYQNLKKKGMLIEPEDLLIAATALGNNMNLATGNIKHFDRVVGLELVVDNLS